MRNFQDTLEWYKTHTTAREIGFDPDHMCLKVCRTARDIPSHFASAKEAQDATPVNHRVYNVADIRRGMIAFFDDPNDSNKFGHIVTAIGRVRGFNADDLNDVLFETNSVVAGELAVVRGNYFLEHWGDPFQFAATYLNGFTLDVATNASRVLNFKRSGPAFNVNYLDRAIKEGKRNDLKGVVHRLGVSAKDVPEDGRNKQLTQFHDAWDKHRVIRMDLLNEVVSKNDRNGKVKVARNRLRSVLKSLPEN